jgi:hypothetical protein
MREHVLVNRAGPWVGVTLISLILIGWMLALWVETECCAFKTLGPSDTKSLPAPLVSGGDVAKALKESDASDLFQMPTGIYIQSLSFESANDVRITGRIWQRVDCKEALGVDCKEPLPDGAVAGVIFPDAITDHGSNTSQTYENLQPVPIDDEAGKKIANLYMWNFQVILRQDMDYSRYPLDGKQIWIRMWTSDVFNKVVLVPDLEAYRDPKDLDLAISPQLVTGEWNVKKSFFGYKRLTYYTNFGRKSELIDEYSRPELRFYILLERKFADAFLVNLVPLFVIVGMLFGLLLSVGRDKGEVERLGFNTLTVFGACSGLFFISLLGHIQIRREFPGSGVVYVEYFYIMSYVVLLLVSVFAFLMTKSERASNNYFLRDNGIIVKLLYWPVILSLCLFISYVKLGDGRGILEAVGL